MAGGRTTSTPPWWRSNATILPGLAIALGVLYLFYVLAARSTIGNGPSPTVNASWTKQSAIWAIVVPLALSTWLIIGHKRGKVALLGYVGLLAFFILYWYSALYYVIGNHHNFSVNVTKGEAFLMALGNLTNVGMAQITPTSDAAHAVVVAQGVTDFLFIVVIIGIVISKLSAPRSQGGT